MDKLLDDISSFVDDAKSTNSSNEKIKILGSYPQLKEFFRYAYSPDLKYHVTPTSLKKRRDDLDGGKVETKGPRYKSLLELLKYLTESTASNKSRDVDLAYIDSRPAKYEDLLWLILNKKKKLDIGIGAKTVSKVYPTLFKQFQVSRGYLFKNTGKKYFDKSIAAGDTWFISRKYDGVRCIVWVSLDKIEMFSRDGNLLLTLDLLKNYITDYVLRAYKIDAVDSPNFIFDGEIIVEDEKGIEDFKTAVGDIKRKDVPMKNFIYKVFDMLTIPEFTSGISSSMFSERTQTLEILLKKTTNLEPPIEIIQYVQQIEYSKDELSQMEKKFSDGGWEGLMLRKDAQYKGKRSNDILKIKRGGTTEEKVEDITTKTKNMLVDGIMKEIDTLSAVIITYNGVKVNVGSGFSDVERVKYYKNPELIIKTIIRIDYMDLTEAGSLRHPVYKGIISEPGQKRTL